MGYLHYSPKADEIADYVAAYSGRVSQVSMWFKGYPEGSKEMNSHLDTLISSPVQVFWADQDAFLSVDNGTRLHARLPNSALTVFENCGHFCYQDKSEAFSEMLQTWVSERCDTTGKAAT